MEENFTPINSGVSFVLKMEKYCSVHEKSKIGVGKKRVKKMRKI